MEILKKILYYINPFNRLGKKQYSIVFPFVVTSFTIILLEVYHNSVINSPELVRTPAVLILLALIVYFSFRDGLPGGITATIITIIYYFYITFSQFSTKENFIIDINNTIAFGALYLILAIIIGNLKQKVDKLLEREANEKKQLQTILQQMPVGVIVVDKNGKVIQANKQLEIISGYKIPIGSILGKDTILIPETYNVKSADSPLIQVLRKGKTLTKQEYLIKRKDGKERYLQINASPIFGKGNQIIAAIAIIIDITQQKELDKRKDDFINIASHELKTPITSMKLYLNSLSSRIEKSNDPQIKKIIKNIYSQTDRLQKLVNDLLDVSRAQTGKMAFTTEPFLLNDLLKETIGSLTVMAKKQNIVFIEKDLVRVYADKFRIHQVITNLITNAIKYSDPYNDIVVQIKKEKDKAVVSVKDSGIGISTDEHKKIFDRLYRAIDTQGKTFPGLGIGLYLSKQIIKKHKGSIWVESEKGKGATFFFSLPLLQKRQSL